MRLWTGYGENKRDRLVTRLLEYHGKLSPKQYFTKRTQITNTLNDYIFSIHYNTGKPKTLIILHGYGGSGAMFYKYFKPLSTSFNIIALDLRGTGLSGRSNIKLNTTEQYEKYFIEAIDDFVSKEKIFRFTILGHSLGGYIAALYADKYPDKIDRAVLLSPVGFSVVDPDEIARIEGHVNKIKFPAKILFKKLKNAWQSGVSPLSYLRVLGRFSGFFFKKYKSYIAIENKVEANDYCDLIYQINVQKPCSDGCLGKLISLKGYGINALEKRVKLPEGTLFIRGDKDWVDSEGIERYIQRDPSCKLCVIPKEGHNLNIKSVDYVVNMMRFEGIL